jgi:hypothetical protein
MTTQPFGVPYPTPVMPGNDPWRLDLSVRISNPTGGWVELNDHVSFTVADGSFTDENVSWRRAEDTSIFLEGAYLVNALRSNITRPLNVYVDGSTHYDMEMNLDQLRSLVGQRQYQVVKTTENVSRLYTCFASDYSTSCDRPLLFARRALLKVQLVTHPVDQPYEEI